MEPKRDRSCTAFVDTKRVASGDVLSVAAKVKEHLKAEPKASVLIFDDQTSDQIEIDFRGTVEAVVKRLEAVVGEATGAGAESERKQGPGRPKLGVVAREVTLLPQHWDWLAMQPGGASITLRKLVEEARKKNHAKDQLRLAQEAAYKFMNVMAGDLSNYEEALRALYAKEKDKFAKLISVWPKDVREHAMGLAKSAF